MWHARTWPNRVVPVYLTRMQEHHQWNKTCCIVSSHPEASWSNSGGQLNDPLESWRRTSYTKHIEHVIVSILGARGTLSDWLSGNGAITAVADERWEIALQLLKEPRILRDGHEFSRGDTHCKDSQHGWTTINHMISALMRVVILAHISTYYECGCIYAPGIYEYLSML